MNEKKQDKYTKMMEIGPKCLVIDVDEKKEGTEKKKLLF